jgi:hypothetical protein
MRSILFSVATVFALQLLTFWKGEEFTTAFCWGALCFFAWQILDNTWRKND